MRSYSDDIKTNYEAFASFVERMPVPRHDDYVEELKRRGLLRKRKRDRMLRTIIDEIGQGFEVKMWKTKCSQNSVIDMINALCDKRYVSVDSDLLDINFILIGTFIPRFSHKEKIDSWVVAESKHCLKSYFSNHDIFNCTEGKSEDYEYNYKGDYYDYIRTYDLKDRIMMYRNYLKLASDDIPIKYNSFDDPRYFVGVSDRQFGEYEKILNLLEDKSRLFIVGDGIGIMSMIALKNGRDYFSIERGGIGMIAVSIGLISEVKFSPAQVHPEDILVLANVEEYLKEEELKEYCSYFTKVLVVAENRVSRVGDPVPYSGNKLFSVGLEVGPLNPPPIARVADYLNVRQPIAPQDYKSKLYVESLGLDVSKEGFRVAFGNREGAFNIRNRKYPSNMKFARKGDIKLYKGVKFKFEDDGQGVVTQDEVFRYYPYDLDNPMILLRGNYREEDDLVIAYVLRPKQIRKYVDEYGVVKPIFFLFSKMVGGKLESYYSTKNVGVASVVHLEDYVIKDDG